MTHDTEYFLVSGAPFLDPRFYPRAHHVYDISWTQSDRDMSLLFMNSWANFAKYGDPTPSDFNSIIWKPMSAQSLEYLFINNTNYTSVMERDYRQKYCQFWNDYLPSLFHNLPSSWPPYFQPIEDELRLYRASAWAVIAIMILLLIFSILCSCLYCRAKR